MMQTKRFLEPRLATGVANLCSRLGPRLGAVTLLGASGANAFADAGHQTPAGVSPVNHLHLASQVTVSPEWGVIGALTVGAAALYGVLRLRAKQPPRNR